VNDEIYNTFVHYLRERENIRLKKESGQPGPWTEDPILSKYKFTNVMRANDWTTRWVKKHWYDPNRDKPLEVQAMACGIFRYFGSAEFAEALGYPEEWEPEKILRTADVRLACGQKVFTGAYIITNQGMSAPKQDVVVTHFLTPMRMNIDKIVSIARETKSFQSVCAFLQTLPGMGAFMSKEIALDFTLTPVLEDATDKLTWSPAGPGAIRGLNRLHDRPLQRGMAQNAALAEMQELLARVAQEPSLQQDFPRIGVEFGVTDIQFSLCELDKYVRVRNGEGRPRSGYNYKKARVLP
jgi:hypothetical protein